jgi:hypothetical protein
VRRTFASVGMVFSFSTAVLVAAHSVSDGTVFATILSATRARRNHPHV